VKAQSESLVRNVYDRLIGLQLDHLAVDGCINKAPCGGQAAGPSPSTRQTGHQTVHRGRLPGQPPRTSAETSGMRVPAPAMSSATVSSRRPGARPRAARGSRASTTPADLREEGSPEERAAHPVRRSGAQRVDDRYGGESRAGHNRLDTVFSRSHRWSLPRGGAEESVLCRRTSPMHDGTTPDSPTRPAAAVRATLT